MCALSDAAAIPTQGHSATGWGPHEIKIKACLKTISSWEVLYKIKQKNKFFCVGFRTMLPAYSY